MSHPYPKRLIEVDLPIKRISAHARREKSIRHGHISTLHIWWARRPLAACRAVICASLWPDPADELCPEAFTQTARAQMFDWAREYLRFVSSESLSRMLAIQKEPARLDDPLALRRALLDFITDFANWDNSTNKHYLKTARILTKIAHESMGGVSGTAPLVIDPFAGGGSIPLEALRVGAEVHASDLNPIPVILNKALLEFIPKYGAGLATEVRRLGEEIKQQCLEMLRELYPTDVDGANPIAYLWARTVKCEGPACGATVPLIKSLWLSKGKRRSVALRYDINHPSRNIGFRIIQSPREIDIEAGTLRRGSCTCPACGYTTPGDRVRMQFKSRRGGADDALLLAVVLEKSGERYYREPVESDYKAVELAKRKRQELGAVTVLGKPIDAIPRECLPYLRSIFNINLLDVTEWGDLFTARQSLALDAIRRTIGFVTKQWTSTDPDFAKAITTFLAFALDRQADYSTSICTWVQSGEFIGHNFAQGQSLPIKWDFAETAPFSSGSGSWNGAIDWVCRVIENVSEGQLGFGTAEQSSATAQVLPDDSASAVFSDPPYYDSVPYADLSDFFYVWLKRTIGDLYPGMFTPSLTPKGDEVVQLAERNQVYSYKTKRNFEDLMRQALTECRRVVAPTGIGVFVFAHKDTSAWEAMLQAVLDGGWVITASWPIDTEMGARLRARNSAALASSIHLTCRPRESSDGSLRKNEIGDWRDVLQELPQRIHAWMPCLAEEGVVGADAIFACLGPALEIFSRFSRVVFAGADTAGFEPDARLTAMWLWTLNAGINTGAGSQEDDDNDAADDGESGKGKLKGGYTLEYDAARKIAQGLGAHLEELPHLVEIKGDQARLLPVAERTKHLFGKEEAQAPTRGRGKKKPVQGDLFADLKEAEGEAGWGVTGTPKSGETILDRIHQSMVLFAASRGEALKRFLVEEGAGRDPCYWSLAQALSALYPNGTDEKRWVDGVLARKKSLGF